MTLQNPAPCSLLFNMIMPKATVYGSRLALSIEAKKGSNKRVVELPARFLRLPGGRGCLLYTSDAADDM
eukprot:8970492-Alexandrium_andersonii.AAC.1